MKISIVRLALALALALVSLLLVACGPSPEKVGEMVKTSMQQTFSTDKQFSQFGLTVESVQAIKESDNRYQGMATIRHDGTTHNVPVQITAQGDNVIWKTEPGAFMFVIQKELGKILQKP